MAEMKKVKCPACREIVEVDVDENLGIGDTICCENCDADLEIVKLNPLLVEVLDSSAEDDDY